MFYQCMRVALSLSLSLPGLVFFFFSFWILNSISLCFKVSYHTLLFDYLLY